MNKPNNTHAFSIRKHPLFGRGIYSEENPPEGVTKSPFYWWFKFLLLNKEYESALKGKKTKIAKSVVKAFGDPKKQDFKAWWQERVDLFAEPQLNYKMIVATNIDEIAPFDSGEVINLVVPLNWTNVGIKRSFARVIDRLVKKAEKDNQKVGIKRAKRGVNVGQSEAEFKVGRKWSPIGFQNAYNVYVEKQKANEELKQGGVKTAWADIGIRAGLAWAKKNGMKVGDKSSKASDDRRVLTIMTMRCYKQAEEYIKASATHTFP